MNYQKVDEIKDNSSFANTHELHQKSIYLDLEVDFDNYSLSGTVVINFLAVSDNVNQIFLDCKNIEISKVLKESKELSFIINKTKGDDYPLGTPLVIYLPESVKINETFSINIEIKTSSKSEAIQWLAKSQTLGKKYPFMFTQCQAILCRSLIPCQDTPLIKAIVTAKLKIRQPLKVLFSGILVSSSSDNDHNIFIYTQDVPIPTYLIAVAAGDVEFKELSSRCGVWAEPEIIEAAATEFVDTETFLIIAENYLTPYEWHKYNILVLPPGFPYGGMENPNLTFVTPSLLAGDKSLVNVIAHEITHSWTGNLVTNSNWENFWVNEGFTRFVERKILEKFYGEDMFLVEAYQGYKELVKTVNDYGHDHTFTSLTPILTDIDPDDAFSIVPYEKGFLLLYYLESLVGKELFQKILQTYIKTFRLKSIIYNDFIRLFESEIEKHLGKEKSDQIIKEIDWNHWIIEPGLPKHKFDYSNSLIDKSNDLAKRFVSGNVFESDKSLFNNFHSSVKLVFFHALYEEKIDSELYRKLVEMLELNTNLNDELLSIWFQITMKNKIIDALPYIKKFVAKVGRIRYLRPIYKGLASIDKEKAFEILEENKYIHV